METSTRRCVLYPSDRLDGLFADVAAIRRMFRKGEPVARIRAEAMRRHIPPSAWRGELRVARLGNPSRMPDIITLDAADLTLHVFDVDIRGVGRFALSHGAPLPGGLTFGWATLEGGVLTLYPSV